MERDVMGRDAMRCDAMRNEQGARGRGRRREPIRNASISNLAGINLILLQIATTLWFPTPVAGTYASNRLMTVSRIDRSPSESLEIIIMVSP